MDINLQSTVADVEALLVRIDTIYTKGLVKIHTDAKRQRKVLLAWRIDRRKKLRRLLDVVKTDDYPDATGGHAAVEEAVAAEVKAGPNGES